MTAMKAHGGSLPVTGSSTDVSGHIPGLTPTTKGTIMLSPAAAGTLQQMPLSGSELAEIRVSMEDLSNDTPSRLSTQ